MLDKLKNLHLNIFQNLALVGLVASAGSQVGLLLMDKKVDTFWAVYVIWAGVLIASTFIRIDMPDHDHDHEH
jgi:hypothetical protein